MLYITLSMKRKNISKGEMGIVKYIYGGNEQCCDRSLVEAIFRRQLRFPSW